MCVRKGINCYREERCEKSWFQVVGVFFLGGWCSLTEEGPPSEGAAGYSAQGRDTWWTSNLEVEVLFRGLTQVGCGTL